MSSLQNRAAKPKSKKKVTSVVSCVEKFLHDGSTTSAMKRTVRDKLEDLKSEFESLINKLSSADENKAEKTNSTITILICLSPFSMLLLRTLNRI